MQERIKILITGAGGAAAVSIIKSLRSEPYELFAADMDPHAAGLYLVASSNREIISGADEPGFAGQILAICRRLDIDLLIPTVDAELIPLAHRKADFEGAGTLLLCAELGALTVVLDKALLVRALEGVIPVPRTEIFEHASPERGWIGPIVVKPRRGAGSKGVRVVDAIPSEPNPDLILQEFLPGEEYSVDVLATRAGVPVAAVPRVRLKVDSGIAVAARTVRDHELEEFAKLAVAYLRLPFVSNVQFRRDRFGTPVLLEINPRFPGTMPLTVKSGVDMPRLAVGHLLGEPLRSSLDFEETAVVRYWEEHFLNPEEMDALATSSLQPIALPAA